MRSSRETSSASTTGTSFPSTAERTRRQCAAAHAVSLLAGRDARAYPVAVARRNRPRRLAISRRDDGGGLRGGRHDHAMRTRGRRPA
jgi:hypothetical protein